MGILDRFKKKAGTPERAAPSKTPAERPEWRAIKDRYGDDVIERLQAFDADVVHQLLSLREAAPFTWVEIDAGWSRGQRIVLIRPTTIVEVRGVDGLRALLEEGVTSDYAPEELVRRAASYAGLTIFDVASTSVAAVARERFEPPHFEGAAFVFFASEILPQADPHAARSARISRFSVDVHSWAINVEPCETLLHVPPMIPPVVRGRALTDDDNHIITSASPSSPSSSSNPPSEWHAAAHSEHASIAAFARLALELMAVGAPLDLVARTHEAARDEIRHTQQCLHLARVLDGVIDEWRPLPTVSARPGDKRALAHRTLLEAVLPETQAVLELRRHAARVSGEERAICLAQAADEERHVELARDIIAWCGGLDVVR